MASIFRFAQVEVPWPLGPDDGRYVLRPHAGEQPRHVVVVATLGAPQRRLLGGRRARSVAPEPDPSPVATGRATVIAAEPFPGEPEAAAWLKRVDVQQELESGLAVLNRTLHAHRVASADPLAREVARGDLLVGRVGIGHGEQVADGRWSEALEAPPPNESRRRRTSALRPQERLAAVLGGRDVALACELMVLRSRSDLDAGRQREAALQLRTALEAALAELPAWAERGDVGRRVTELGGERETAEGLARTALGRGLDPEEVAEVERILGRLEAALRARSAAGFG